MNLENCSYIVEGIRLPIGKVNGIYKRVIPEVFTAELMKYFLQKYPYLKHETDELILGCALGTGGNMARFTALEAGFHENMPAFTIDAQCASGLKAVILANSQIKSGANCIIAGGMESNSLAPKRQYQPNDQRFIDANSFYTQASFAPDKFGDASLLKAAENVALTYQITKEKLLEWAVESHAKASKSIHNEFLKKVIIPFENYTADQSIKADITYERLKATETQNLIDHTNTVHLHDGACVHLLASESFCKQHQLKPSFKILSTATTAGPANMAPMGVIWAVEKLLNITGQNIDAIDLFEVNESFVVNAVAFAQHFQVNTSKMNIFGGNLAFGHPFGASGAINLLHLMQAMKYQNAKLGVVSIAAAGGLGMAVMLEKL